MEQFSGVWEKYNAAHLLKFIFLWRFS